MYYVRLLSYTCTSVADFDLRAVSECEKHQSIDQSINHLFIHVTLILMRYLKACSKWMNWHVAGRDPVGSEESCCTRQFVVQLVSQFHCVIASQLA